ncbi:MAG: hypothetical protein NC111_06945 [Bacteroides sp.]|nr:hypothetical protein [Bacteroides sp.]MCM1413738.1 hypothetical protein [Bacteroides sp.]MCM1472243.1 hypothetical protein [Bacteroides sp.]
MKRLLQAISLLACVIATAVASHAANSVPGTWTIHPTYANPPQKVLETDEQVYMLTGNNLFSYDMKNDETNSYTIDNKLNDSSIANIFYNFEKKYLVICYSNGNIDLLYDDGHVVNMSDIKDSSINPPLTINAVAFDGDFMYVATEFGVVKFNIQRAEVVTSGNYGLRVNALAIMGNRLVIHADGHFRCADKNGNISRLDSYQELYAHNGPTEIVPVDDTRMLVQLNHNDYVMALHTINFETGHMQGWKTFTSHHDAMPPYLIHTSDGRIMYVADDALYEVSNDFEEVKLADLPEPLQGSMIGTNSGLKSVWSLSGEGLANYTLDGFGGLTVNIDRLKAGGFPVMLVRYFYPSPDGKRLYAQNSGLTSFKFSGSTRGLENAQTAAYIDLATGEYHNVTPYPVEATTNIVKNYQRTYGKYILAPMGLAEDPNDQNTLFMATADDGVYKITDGEIVGRYGHLNSPVPYIDNRDIFYAGVFDNYGNLWTSINNNGWKNSPIMILPADKVKLDPADVKASDWVVPDLSKVDYWGGQDVRMVFCKKSNIVFIISTSGDFGLAYDHRGTGSNFADDKFMLWEKIYDQDGKQFSPRFYGSVIEDLNGKIWVGTNEGIIEINPANLFNSSATFTHLKVPRNDGSNLADYLLGSDMVMDMSVDAANRKWIATTASGLFLVSASGDKIIENFTAENSLLPTNKINCVYADKATGIVYVGTDYGLMSYTSDATPVATDFDDILVYPNPVRPEYRGNVNITGLMDNSLVKIADASGSVVAQGRSEGGRFVWNCCNSAGVRVKTGVYYVLASQNASGSSSAAVAKIMVVN